MPKLSALTHLGYAKETIWGTPVAATKWIPVKNPKPEDVTKFIDDKGLRGAMADLYATYQGLGNGTYGWDGDFYPDLCPFLFLMLFGQDTVTGTTNYTHKFQLAAAQPPSHTLSDFNGINERQFAGAMLEQLDLKFAVDGGLEYSAKTSSKLSAAATTTTPTYGTIPPLLGWQGALTIAGAANTDLIGFDMSIKRKPNIITTAQNTQAPKGIILGPMSVTGKMTFAVEDDTELTNYLNNTQPAVLLTLTQNVNVVLTLQMSKCALKKAAYARSKDYVELDMNYEAIYNVTDGGPMLAQVLNQVATY